MFWKLSMEQSFQQHSLVVKLLSQPGVIKQQGAESSMKTASDFLCLCPRLSSPGGRGIPVQLGQGQASHSANPDLRISGAALLSIPFSSWEINPQSNFTYLFLMDSFEFLEVST